LAAEFAFIFAPKDIISFHPPKRGDREKRGTTRWRQRWWHYYKAECCDKVCVCVEYLLRAKMRKLFFG